MIHHPIVSPHTGERNDQPVFVLSCMGLFLALFLLLAFPGDVPAHGNLDPVVTGRYNTGNALLFLNVENIDDLWDFVEKWESEGAWFPHVYPPDLVIGDVPFDLESNIESDHRVAELCRKPARPRMGKRADRWKLVTESWNLELEPREIPTKTIMEFNDVLIPPVDISTRPLPKRADNDPDVYGCAYGADFYQTSEFIMGKVAVGVILPDGPGYTYDEDGIIFAHEGVRGAMQVWAQNVRYPGVRFVYRYHTMIPTTRNFQTIDPMTQEDEWLEEIMGYLGYTFGAGKNYSDPIESGPVYEFIDSMRVQMRTEWGICMFIPSAPNGFGAGYTAYAHLGGPHLVVPSGHKGEIPSRGYSLADLIVHESGHLFWALDEYYPGGTTSPCHERSGYLGIHNLNSRNVDYTCVGIPKVPCAMNIPSSQVCQYTLGQMGVWDTDDDIIPDILDTHPYVRAEDLPDTITTVFPEIRGVAAVMPVINQCIGGSQEANENGKAFGNRNNITFNTIEHVIYRIDNAMTLDGEDELWLLADPDGGWGGDSLRVHFAFRPDSLTGGDHTITIRGVNTSGNVSNWGEERIELFVKAIALHNFSAEPDFEGKVKLSYKIRGAAFDADATLYRIDPAGNEVVIRQFNLQDDSIRNLYDSGFDSGTAFIYRLQASALGMTWNWTTDVVSPAYIATNQYLSRIEPHPFRPNSGENLKISVRVPRGELLPRTGNSSGKPGGSTYVPQAGSSGSPQFTARSAVDYKNVRLDIHIYNLAGRFVKKLARFEAPEGFPETMVEWDGTNSSGERVAAGMYFLLLKAGDDVWETRKVLLLP